jgi:MFS family permease
LQGVLGYNASSAGLWVLPRTFMVAVGCWLAGRYLGLTGRYKHFLTSVMVIHMFATVGTYFWDINPMWNRLMYMNIEGFVFGCVLVATMVALVADIAPQDTASATSMIFLCRSTGWLSGSTVSAAILQSRFKKYLEKEIQGPEAAEIVEFVRTSITQVRTLKPEVQTIVVNVLQKAIKQAFLYGVAASICCFLATVCMRNCQLKSQTKKIKYYK